MSSFEPNITIMQRQIKDLEVKVMRLDLELYALTERIKGLEEQLSGLGSAPQASQQQLGAPRQLGGAIAQGLAAAWDLGAQVELRRALEHQLSQSLNPPPLPSSE
jgi:chromosome segregation ATPase